MDDESIHEHKTVRQTARQNETKLNMQTVRGSPVFVLVRRGIALAALGGPIYAIGGLDDNSCFSDVERYDIESDRWSAVAAMNTPRGGVGSVALGVRKPHHESLTHCWTSDISHITAPLLTI